PDLGGGVVGWAEHHQRRPPPAVDRVLHHGPLLVGAVPHHRQQQLVALALVERLLLADPHHRPRVRAVGAAAQRHLVADRRPVDEPADHADVRVGQRRVVEDRGVLLPAGDEQLGELLAVDAERLRGRVQVQAVAGLVLHLGQQDRLAPQAGGPPDPVALGLHPDDLRVRVLGDLADQRLPVRLGHPVARLDPLVGGDRRLEVRREGSFVHAQPPYRMFVRFMVTHGARTRNKAGNGAYRRAGRMPSNTARATASGRVPGSRAGRAHSPTEFTRPDSSRAASAGSMSSRSSPASTASRTSAATRASYSRRRSRAHRSDSVLPRTRSSTVTYGSSATRTFTCSRTMWRSRSTGVPVRAPSESRIANRPFSARSSAARSSASLPLKWW